MTHRVSHQCAQPFRTRKTDSSAQGMETTSANQQCVTIKVNCSGPVIMPSASDPPAPYAHADDLPKAHGWVQRQMLKKQQCLRHHDDSTCRSVQKVTDPRAEETGYTANSYSNHEQAGKRSVNNHAVAPGVTTRQITRKAPTVCNAATVDTASSVKKRIFNLPDIIQ